MSRQRRAQRPTILIKFNRIIIIQKSRIVARRLSQTILLRKSDLGVATSCQDIIESVALRVVVSETAVDGRDEVDGIVGLNFEWECGCHGVAGARMEKWATGGVVGTLTHCIGTGAPVGVEECPHGDSDLPDVGFFGEVVGAVCVEGLLFL